MRREREEKGTAGSRVTSLLERNGGAEGWPPDDLDDRPTPLPLGRCLPRAELLRRQPWQR
jgi:hypothetical protein